MNLQEMSKTIKRFNNLKPVVGRRSSAFYKHSRSEKCDVNMASSPKRLLHGIGYDSEFSACPQSSYIF